MDSTLADKVLKKTPLDLQKRSPIYHACPKCFAAYRCGSAFPENGLAFRQDLEKVRKTQIDWERGIVHYVLILWGRWGRRRRRYSPSRSCAGCVAWNSGCWGRCAAQGASGWRSGRRRRRTSRSRKGRSRGQGETLMCEDGMEWRLKNILSQWSACDTTSRKTETARCVPCSRVQLARVGVRVLVLVDVVCVIVMLVLIAHVDVVHAVDTVSVAIFLYLEVYSLHHPSVTVIWVSCNRNDHCNFAPNSLWGSCHK